MQQASSIANQYYKPHGHNLEIVYILYGKYLGVTISALALVEAYQSTLVSARQTESSAKFLRRTLNRRSQEVKGNAYCTLVRKGLEYAPTVWDTYNAFHVKNLEAVHGELSSTAITEAVIQQV